MTLNTRIAPALERALVTKGYDSLTEVQDAVLTEEAAGADLLVSAQTGSGKTVAFGLAIAPDVLGDEDTCGWAGAPVALVVAPTRELALQVQRELAWLYGDAGARIATCVGGMDARAERRVLERGCHIVVGTPGRLRDHIERRALDLSELRAVVLDEADEMLDFGFREDLEFILEKSPESRRTLLFSATVPRAITDIARRYQKNAVRISTVSENSQHSDIEYQAMLVVPQDRENAIINLLRFHDAERAIVFCATREAVNRLATRFGNRGFNAVALSGELSQNERTHALQALRDGRARVCVATDVAARGIDLPGLELVIHADLPNNGDTLKHRSGRTGRAGRKGICSLIVPLNRRGKANRLLRDAGVKAEWVKVPGQDEIRAKDRDRLYADPILTEKHDDELYKDAQALLEAFEPEQIAAAFLKHRLEAEPAAEDLRLIDPDDRNARSTFEAREPRPARAPFNNGVWFTLTAGRKHRAEPRWLLPLICRVGDVTRTEVGSIQIGEAASKFEIDGHAVAKFEEAVAKAGGGEKNIRIARDDGTVEVSGGPGDFAGRPPRDRKDGFSKEGHRKGGKKPFRKSGDEGEGEFRPDRPKFGKPGNKPGGAKLKGKFRGSPTDSSPRKPRADRPVAAATGEADHSLKKVKRKPKFKKD
ncbi:DEAD/DEAH box helicase [Maricaulis sp. CAU 1757]